jgi:hypothetical protein
MEKGRTARWCMRRQRSSHGNFSHAVLMSYDAFTDLSYASSAHFILKEVPDPERSRCTEIAAGFIPGIEQTRK